MFVMKIILFFLMILVSGLSYSKDFDVYDECIMRHEDLVLEVRKVGSRFISDHDFFEENVPEYFKSLRGSVSFCEGETFIYYDVCENKYFSPSLYLGRVDLIVNFPMRFMENIYFHYVNLGWMKIFYRHDKYKNYYLVSNYDSELEGALDVLTFLKDKKNAFRERRPKEKGDRFIFY
ncbi:hypothetical protein KO507_16520 [Gilvimarinus agarilyticus]|uniref:hypothetical protein n=1 Tax=Gilvimarinus sp. 2_MG-2023 TaxID=3062666 RepID=UPI001C08CC28|nr:hypothetical protein [Gilvimarinus sp. 2_MG-2023]MBU2887371.1 hypothetical protein [Gilvimarinus agarilyticus]MDO6572030.1 hypothetical protein [Gilvimarinus sp. 2_MG-2023]